MRWIGGWLAVVYVACPIGGLMSGCSRSGPDPTPSTTTLGKPTQSTTVLGKPAESTTVLRALPPPPATTKPALPHKASLPILKDDARSSFAALQRSVGHAGRISIAVEPLGSGPMEVLGGDPPMQGMSTTKVMILAAVLRDRRGAAELTPAERDEAHAAITKSDNQAILDLFRVLEQDRGGLLAASAYATQLLRADGDSETKVATAPPPPLYSTTFGQTKWSPTASIMFFRELALGCLLPPADTRYVLGLMRSIEPSENWGLGSAGFSSVAFKGGWGPEPGGLYGVRQTGVIGQGDSGAVVAITVFPASSFAGGTSILTTVARWLRREIRSTPRPTGTCR